MILYTRREVLRDNKSLLAIILIELICTIILLMMVITSTC